MELNKNMLSSTKNQHRSDMKLIITQSLTALGPIINTVTAGLTSGYSAVLLPQLNSTLNNSSHAKPIDYFDMTELNVTSTEEASWVASAAALTMGPACLLSGLMMEMFGRKGSFLISCPVQLSGWLMMAFAPNVIWLIIGRLICGVCSGFNGPLTPVFIAETSEPRIRGPLLSGISMGIALGVMLSHALGTYLHWRLTAFLCGLIQVVIFILCVIHPESPTWLLKKNKPEKAHKVWVRLRGKNCEKEFETLLLKSGAKGVNVISAEMELEKSLGPTNEVEETVAEVSWKDAVFTRTFMMPFFILNVVFFTSQFSGPNAIAFYSVSMFSDVAGPESAYTGTLVLDFIRLVCSILACWLTRNYGRRMLMFLSGYATAISLALASGSIFMDIGRPWLPVCFIFAYMCSITIGLVPLPWLLCGELYASSVRGLGSGITSAMAFLYFFIVVKAAPGMFEDIGPAWTYTCYGIVAFLGSVFMYFWLPETKDKTLQEISDFFVSKKVKKVSETENK